MGGWEAAISMDLGEFGDMPPPLEILDIFVL